MCGVRRRGETLRIGRCGWAAVLVASLAPQSGSAQDAEDRETPRTTAADWGALHRIAAAHESTLDIYRLALLELVPAVEIVAEEGQLGNAAAAVFDNLHRAIHHRVPRGALPGVSLAYHAEALEATAALSLAQTAAEIRLPTAALLRAVSALRDQGRLIVDLFSRTRPLAVRVIDRDDLFDELSQALDEVRAAEDSVRRLQRERAAQDALAAAFRRTELALGHVLDIWATARRLGIRLDEPETMVVLETSLGRATERLQVIGVELDRSLAALAAVDARLRRPPPEPNAPMAVVVRSDASDETRAAAEVSWIPPGKLTAEEDGEGDASIAEMRLFRLADDGGSTLISTWPWSAAEHSFTDTLEGGAKQDVPIYQLTFVSPFGVTATGRSSHATVVYRRIRPAGPVQTIDHTPGPFADDFYRRAGEVEVSWVRSPSDYIGRPTHLSQAAEHGCPAVTGYMLERRVGTVVQRIAALAPGIDRYVDRPPAQAFSEGVAYRVVTLVDANHGVLAAAEEQWSATIRRSLAADLDLAGAGAGSVGRPTSSERAHASRLLAPAALRSARAVFLRRPIGHRAELRAAFWRSLPFVEVKAFLRRWPELFADADLSDYPSTAIPPAPLHAGWLQASYWLDRHPELAAEPERWWATQSASRRRDCAAQWRAVTSRGQREYLQRNPEYAARQVRTLSWWLGRGEPEREALSDWWFEQLAGEQAATLKQYVVDLPRAVRRDLRWPPWAALSPAVQRAYMQSPPSPFPPHLERHFYAWLHFEELPAADKLAFVAADTGALRGLAAGLKYRLRRFDSALGFRLPFYGLLSVVLTAFLVWRLRRRRRKNHG